MENITRRARERLAKVSPKATKRQQEYMDQLFSEIGFDRLNRNLYLSDECEREIHYLDDLTRTEAGRLIEELEERRDRDRD